ncbi:ankyrin repeat-containing protein [Spatholobus suberectus]|nr:ankyrin repeat-containing protein [Spatholobus suberectus]
MTPLDVLMLFQSEAGDLEIYTTLQKAGAKRGKDISSPGNNQVHASNMGQSGAPLELEIIHDNQVPLTSTSTEESLRARILCWPSPKEFGELFGYKPNRDSPSDERDNLLTVAALMTTATYQAVLSPPGGVWQDDTNGHSAGKSIMGTKDETAFWAFIVGNSVNFISVNIHLIRWWTVMPWETRLYQADSFFAILY